MPQHNDTQPTSFAAWGGRQALVGSEQSSKWQRLECFPFGHGGPGHAVPEGKMPPQKFMLALHNLSHFQAAPYR